MPRDGRNIVPGWSPPPHPCGGPVEAKRKRPFSVSFHPSLRRIRAAAPLKRHTITRGAGSFITPPPHPCGGPVEAVSRSLTALFRMLPSPAAVPPPPSSAHRPGPPPAHLPPP